MPAVHLVWDWNGTLLSDLDHILTAVTRSVGRFGLPAVTGDDYRDHFTRPVRLFYDNLFGRRVTDMEWTELNKTFHDHYYEVVDDIALSAGAREALDAASGFDWGQSLLSMSSHEHLVPTVHAHQIEGYFRRIDGLEAADGGLKETALKEHLVAMDVDPGTVWLIGDTPDDHDAAVAVGARVVLYDGGSHHRSTLDSIGVPVMASLTECVDFIHGEVG